MWSDDPRDQLHSDAENYDVFCERCQKVHRYYTFTKEDYDKVIAEGARKLSEAIDAEALAAVAKIYGLAPEPEPPA
jgi:hypothetical protein